METVRFFPGLGGTVFGGGLFFSLAGLLFLVVVGVFVFTLISGVSQWSRNNNSPVLTVDARLVAKRVSHSTHNHPVGDGAVHHHTSSSYYATFQVESGDRMEFSVSGREYGLLAEGDEGRLTFQGTRYHGFERCLSRG